MSPIEKHQAGARDKVIYTAKTRTSGGRESGMARSCDGRLDIKLSFPGSARIGTNPEQLLGAGWSACFESSIANAARKRKLIVPEITIDAEIDLRQADGEYFISARFNVNLPGLDRDTAKYLITEAEKNCTYCKLARGNIDVVFNLA